MDLASVVTGAVLLAGTAVAYLVSPFVGRLLAAAAPVILVTQSLWSGDSTAIVFGDLSLWALVVALVAVVGTSEAHARRRGAAGERVAASEEESGDRRRVSRSLIAVASGLQASFEPERRLHRCAALVRTLLGAEAAILLLATDGRRLFRIVDVSADAEPAPPNDQPVYPIEGIENVGVQTLSFSAGETGLFGAQMREHLHCSAGYAAPILRGKQIAGILVVGYAEPDRRFVDADRAILAGSAALCATLFESVGLQHELRASNKVKAEFISTVSHELRTPLNAIIGYCDLLFEGLMGEVNDEQRDALARLKRHAVEFAELIGAILEVDRLEGAYISVDWAECDLDVFFHQLETSIPEYWRKGGVELRFEGRAGRKIRTDPEKLKLSLRNLIHNALKFTPSGSVVVEMAVTPGTVLFAVRDTGMGIPPEVRESLFQMFQPGERSDNRRRGGLGLGLYLADRMVKALWGQISIDSAPGEGTVARIVLPVEEPVSVETTVAAKKASQ